MPPRKSNASAVSAAATEDLSMLSERAALTGPDAQLRMSSGLADFGSPGVATPTTGGAAVKGAGGRKKQAEASNEQAQLGIDDYMMPRMMTVRLAKGVLPAQTLIHKDAATAMQYASSVFLNHVAGNANAHTLAGGRKNISPQDILDGIREAEWDFLLPQLEEELAIYVRQVNDKRNEYRRKLKERGSGVGAGVGGGGSGGDGDGAGGAADSAGGDHAANGPDADGAMEEDDEEELEEEEYDVNGSDGGPRAKRARLSAAASASARLDDSQMDDDLGDDQQDDDEEGEDDDVVDDDEEEQQDGVDDDDDDQTEEEVELQRSDNENQAEEEDESGDDSD